MYVAGYATKKLDDNETFNLMSRRPGIGHSWLDKYKNDLTNDGIVVINGKEFQVPERYMRWEEEEFEEVKNSRKAHFENLSPEQVCLNREKLRSREVNLKSSVKQKRETI